MKCDFCENKAKVFLTQLVEGEMKKVCLCESCAKERGVTDPTGFALADMLFSGIPDPGGKKSAKRSGDKKACPNCGFTAEDFERVRRLGCSECYQTFASELSSLIETIHKGTMHKGKSPAGAMEARVFHQRIEELQTRLEQAIASESYEEAAGLRDEIRSLQEARTH